jgi:hypothetical protein
MATAMLKVNSVTPRTQGKYTVDLELTLKNGDAMHHWHAENVLVGGDEVRVAVANYYVPDDPAIGESSVGRRLEDLESFLVQATPHLMVHYEETLESMTVAELDRLSESMGYPYPKGTKKQKISRFVNSFLDENEFMKLGLIAAARLVKMEK